MKIIKLTKGQETLVDDDDFDALSKNKWYAQKLKETYYAARVAKCSEENYGSIIYMHREILGVTSRNILVDHEDRDGLNNQRYNLREATKSQNAYNCGMRRRNTSGFKGVTKLKSGKWNASITCERKYHHLGNFDTAEEASESYINASIKLQKEFRGTE